MLWRRVLFLVSVVAVLSAGCNSILGFSEYNVAEDGGGAAQCNANLAGGECYPCKPATDPQFLNACTDSTCVPFDDKARVSKLPLDGALPPVPDLPPPEDAGGSE
jgi:hypothetical protein